MKYSSTTKFLLYFFDILCLAGHNFSIYFLLTTFPLPLVVLLTFRAQRRVLGQETLI